MDGSTSSTTRYALDDLVVDVGRREVLRGAETLPISGLSFDLLLALIRTAPNVVTYDELMERVWQDAVVGTETVAQRAKLVRDALGDDARSPRYIAGVRGRGYCVVAPVSVLPVDAQPMHVDATVNGAPDDTTRGRALRWGLGVIALIVAGAFLGVWLVDLSIKPHVTYRQVTQSRDAFAPSVSPLPIVTDGPRLYFSEWNLPQTTPHRPRQVSINGGESLPLDSPFDPESVHVVLGTMNERADLVINTFNPFISEGATWLWAPAGGSPRRLDAPFGQDRAWSPDEANMVYANKNEVFLADGDGSNSRKLLTAPGRVYWLRFSPDGETIRFSVNTGHYFSLWEVSVDGRRSHQFLEGWNDLSNECCGSWTPDGKYYVFQATRDGVTQIWAVREGPLGNAFGFGAPFQLTRGPMELARPTVSPDGKTLYAIGTHHRGQVMRYDPETKRFVPYLNERAAEWLAYSPDHEWVAYVSYPSGDLWRSRSDGSDPVKLTLPKIRPNPGFSWSPDNKTIAFAARTPTGDGPVYLIAADGRTPPTKLTTADRIELCPSWSPNGRSIAFATATGLRIYDLSSGTDSPVHGGEGIFCSSWSPDSQRLVASTFDGKRIVLFDFATQRWEPLQGIEGPGYGRWSPDGKYIFVAQVYPRLLTLRVRLEDRTIEPIASIKDEPSMFGIYGHWLGMTQDGSPLYLRDERVQHIYAMDWED